MAEPARTRSNKGRTHPYPWESGEYQDPDWQCIYCGRYIKDVKAVRKVKEGGETLDACLPCWFVVKISKTFSLEGRQERVRRVLKITNTPASSRIRVYVSREGLEMVEDRGSDE